MLLWYARIKDEFYCIIYSIYLKANYYNQVTNSLNAPDIWLIHRTAFTTYILKTINSSWMRVFNLTNAVPISSFISVTYFLILN